MALGLVKVFLRLVLVGAGVMACNQQQSDDSDATLFSRVDMQESGIRFRNDLSYSEEFNTYTYRNFYNGAGVGVGDFNNDGLADLYFAANQTGNYLYVNKGDFRFEEIGEKAGVRCPEVWSTGVSIVDINSDGWLDIYVCKSGKPGGARRHNELFVNNHDLTFTEKSKEYGLDVTSLSVQAVFLDYDRDGDLDCYLLSNSVRSVGGYDLVKDLRLISDETGGGNKLLRNDNGRYVDVSEAAGIFTSKVGFGLGVTTGDFNNDGWTDIFVSNDFFERDYLYLNQHNGVFKELLTETFGSVSLGSMGADLGDVNRDGFPDLFVTEMVPQSHSRYKSKATFEGWDKYQLAEQAGYYHQYPRNVLQLNNGNGTFSEVGRLAGVEATDWSWGALIADYDRDGWNDIFVANGIYKDLLDQDYVNFMADPETVRAILSKEGKVLKKLVDMIPSEPVANVAFRNRGDLTFDVVSSQWGLTDFTFSNGSAYVDLDNDGDYDLVTNNVNQPALVYRNHASEQTQTNFLGLDLVANTNNTFALNARVFAYAGAATFFYEVTPFRGFMSSVDIRPLIGLGSITTVDSVAVYWPDGRYSVVLNPPVNRRLTISQASATEVPRKKLKNKFLFETEASRDGLPAHRENDFVDFDRDRLVYHMISNEGPRACTGDVNRDGLTDVYMGGASGQPGSLLVQQDNGQFMPIAQTLLAADSTSEDCGCTFFDADGDGDQDLYVTSGGNEFSANSTALIDRLYINEGTRWRKSEQLLPTTKFESTSVVSAGDVDQDGDQDLFVGVRLQPLYYGVPVSSYVLANDGRGQFTDVTSTWAPGLQQVGMITDGHWVDLDGDRDLDLVVSGEWTAIRVFINQGDRLVDQTAEWGTLSTKGWWNRLAVKDLDGDGDVDVIGGNHGWNSRFKATEAKPVTMWVNDFDGNGTVEHIVARYWGETQYPMALRHDLVQQLPYLKKKYLKYENYKDQTVADIFGAEALQKSVRLDAQQLGSVILWNEGGRFRQEVLPVEAQISSVYGILAEDLDQDGQVDILLGGNQYRAKPEVGRYDGSYGLYLRGLGSQRFEVVPNRTSGLKLEGEIRDIIAIKVAGKSVLFALRNNQSLQTVRINNP